MAPISKLAYFAKQLREGKFDRENGTFKEDFAWRCFDLLAQEYQREQKIKFMAYPSSGKYSLIAWIDDVISGQSYECQQGQG